MADTSLKEILFTFHKQSFINFYHWIVTVTPFKRDSSQLDFIIPIVSVSNWGGDVVIVLWVACVTYAFSVLWIVNKVKMAD